MPNYNGVTLAKNIRKKQIHCEIIFVTILKEYVLNAFEVEALDYIYKPIDTKGFQKCSTKSNEKITKKKTAKISFYTNKIYDTKH